MNTVYTPVGIGKTEREYDNAVGQQAMYELAVSENPDYASLASRGSGPPYPPPSQFVDVEYDEASGGLVREAEEEAEQLEGDYIQTACACSGAHADCGPNRAAGGLKTLALREMWCCNWISPHTTTWSHRPSNRRRTVKRAPAGSDG